MIIKIPKRRGRWPRQLPPIPIERRYSRELEAMVRTLSEITQRRLVAALPKLRKEAERFIPANLKTDAYPEDLRGVIDDMRIEFAGKYSPSEIRRLARATGESAASWNAKQLGRVFGIDVFGSELWLAPEIQSFAFLNSNLITSIPEKLFTEVESIAVAGLQNGTRVEDIAAEFSERFGVSDSRAQLLARDQIGKLSGQLTKLRQSELGIRKYTWRTAGDDRVRDSHARKDGKVYSWNDPPADTGHPGEDFQCRCYAEPVLADREDSGDNEE